MSENEVKNLIDGELADLYVTDGLRDKTLHRIFRPRFASLAILRKHFMQFATLFSTFAVMVIIGFNFLNQNKPGTADYNITNLNAPCPGTGENTEIRQLSFQLSQVQPDCTETADKEG